MLATIPIRMGLTTAVAPYPLLRRTGWQQREWLHSCELCCFDGFAAAVINGIGLHVSYQLYYQGCEMKIKEVQSALFFCLMWIKYILFIRLITKFGLSCYRKFSKKHFILFSGSAKRNPKVIMAHRDIWLIGIPKCGYPESIPRKNGPAVSHDVTGERRRKPALC